MPASTGSTKQRLPLQTTNPCCKIVATGASGWFCLGLLCHGNSGSIRRTGLERLAVEKRPTGRRLHSESLEIQWRWRGLTRLHAIAANRTLGRVHQEIQKVLTTCPPYWKLHGELE